MLSSVDLSNKIYIAELQDIISKYTSYIHNIAKTENSVSTIWRIFNFFYAPMIFKDLNGKITYILGFRPKLKQIGFIKYENNIFQSISNIDYLKTQICIFNSTKYNLEDYISYQKECDEEENIYDLIKRKCENIWFMQGILP